MTKQTGILTIVLIAIIILAITALIIFERDPGELIAIIPALIALWAGNRADKAAQAAEQAVHNTNGRMGQMIQATIDRGGVVDVEEYADVIKHQDITVPEEQAIHSGNVTPINREEI